MLIKTTRMMLLALHPVLKISSLIPMTALKPSCEQSHKDVLNVGLRTTHNFFIE